MVPLSSLEFGELAMSSGVMPAIHRSTMIHSIIHITYISLTYPFLPGRL